MAEQMDGARTTVVGGGEISSRFKRVSLGAYCLTYTAFGIFIILTLIAHFSHTDTSLDGAIEMTKDIALAGAGTIFGTSQGLGGKG